MSNSDSTALSSKIRHAMTQWLLPLYKWVGVGHPKASLVTMFLIGGLIFGGMWYLTGREYQESLKKNLLPPPTQPIPESTTQPKNVSPKTEVKNAEIIKEKQKPPVKKAEALVQQQKSPAVLVQEGGKWNSTGDTIYAPDRTAIENKGEIVSKNLRVNPGSPQTVSEQLETLIAASAVLRDSEVPIWSQYAANFLKRNFSEEVSSEFLALPDLAKKREFLKRYRDSSH